MWASEDLWFVAFVALAALALVVVGLYGAEYVRASVDLAGRLGR